MTSCHAHHALVVIWSPNYLGGLGWGWSMYMHPCGGCFSRVAVTIYRVRPCCRNIHLSESLRKDGGVRREAWERKVALVGGGFNTSGFTRSGSLRLVCHYLLSEVLAIVCCPARCCLFGASLLLFLRVRLCLVCCWVVTNIVTSLGTVWRCCASWSCCQNTAVLEGTVLLSECQY